MAVLVVFACRQLYLGTFHPSDIVVGVTSPSRSCVNAFRFFTPNEVFPVAYRQGKTAHLDVGGRRGEAHPPRGPGPARADGRRRRSRSASPARAARRRCGSRSPATPTPTCSGSSTR